MPSRGRVKPTWFPACLGHLSGTEPLSKIAKCAGKVLGFSLLFQAVRAWISSTFSNLARSGEGDLLSFIKQFPLFSPSESRRSHADPTHSSPSAGTKSFDFCPDFSWDPDELPTSPCSLWEPQGLGLHAVGSSNIDPFSSHQPRNMNLAMAIRQALLETVSVPIKKWR